MNNWKSKAEGTKAGKQLTMGNPSPIRLFLPTGQAIINFFMVLFLLFPFSADAGSLDSSAAPTDSGSAMYTLSDIYNRLNAGTTGTKRAGSFTEPSVGPASTGNTLDDVMGKSPTVDDTNGLTPSETTSGKTFWGLNSGTWGLQTGSNANVVDTSTGDATATDIANGKKAWVDGSEITGSLYAGITCTGTLNGTRWCDNGDGTVTDLNTGLMWLQEADWGSTYAFWVNAAGTQNAHDKAASLTAAGNAALSDGSVEGDWRLPTLKELKALTGSGTEDVLSGTMRAFTCVQASTYWSSTTYSASTTFAWYMILSNGAVSLSNKTNTHYVWPVRGGQ